MKSQNNYNQSVMKQSPKPDLRSEEYLVYLESGFEEMLYQESVPEAKKTVALLTQGISDAKIKDTNPELFNRYQRLILKLRFLAISALDQKSIVELLEKHLLFGLSLEGYDIKESLDRYMVTLTYELDLLDFMVLLEKLVESNQLRLGQNPILDKAGNKKIQTVQTWLAEYNKQSVYNFDKPRGAFEHTTFLTKNVNVQKLSNTEKQTLAKLLDMYDWMKFPGTYKSESEISKLDDASAKALREVFKNPEKVINDILKSEGKFSEEQDKVQQSSHIPSRTVPHGESIEDLKQRIESTTVDLSKSSRSKVIPSVTPSKINPVMEEIKREVETPELPSHVTDSTEHEIGNSKQEIVNRRQLSKLRSIDDIRVVDDLKNIEISHLEQGELKEQIAKIKTIILHLAQINKMLRFQVVNVFEQSPLFKQYLFLGGALLSDHTLDRKAAFNNALAKLRASNHAGMTLAEFEAVSDLRKELERL